MEKNKIIVVGSKGKMGSVVVEYLKKQGYIVSEIDKDDALETQSSDLVIDFSVAANTIFVANWCKENNIPLIVGTTGHNERQQKELEEISTYIPIFKAGNFSIGIAMIKKCLNLLIDENIMEITVCEKHHRNKKDTPSGTAVELKTLIENNWNGKVEVLAERGGKEVGEHVINCYFENEVVSLKHVAYSRECFADGVLIATKFMLRNTETKMFSFDDVFLESSF